MYWQKQSRWNTLHITQVMETYFSVGLLIFNLFKNYNHPFCNTNCCYFINYCPTYKCISDWHFYILGNLLLNGIQQIFEVTILVGRNSSSWIRLMYIQILLFYTKFRLLYNTNNMKLVLQLYISYHRKLQKKHLKWNALLKLVFNFLVNPKKNNVSRLCKP